MASLPGYVALEAQLSSSALRHLQVRFGSVNTKRGDGWVIFHVSPIPEGQLGTEVQRLCTSLVRDVTTRTTIRLDGDGTEVDCNQLLESAIPFNKVLNSVAATGLSNLSELPDVAPIRPMLEMLYEDLAGEIKGGMQLITDFPKIFCPTDERLDVIMLQRVCLTAYSNTSAHVFPNYEGKDKKPEKVEGEGAEEAESKVSQPAAGGRIWISVRAFAHALCTYASTAIEKELPPQWRSKSFNITEAVEVLKLVYRRLVSYWNSSSKSDRQRVNAISLLSIVSGDLREYIKAEMLVYGSDWRAPWRMDLGKVSAAKQLCQQWHQMITQLQQTDWKNWDGEPYTDDSFETFYSRMKDLARIRQLVASVVTLTEKTPDTLLPELIFDNVDGFGDLTSRTSKKWKKCVAAFDKEFSFLEPQLKGRIKQLVGATSGDSLLRVFQTYSTLIRQPSLRQAVEREISAIFDYFTKQVEVIRSRYENNSRRCTSDLQRIRAARSCQTEAAAVPECASRVFGAGPDLDKLIEVSKAVYAEAQTAEESAIKQWKASIETQAKKIITMTDAVVVKVEGTSPDLLLQCTVSQALVQFLQEVRNSRRYCEEESASETTRNTISACEKLLAASMKMQQSVSNFNTVIRQAIPCTRVMLEPAINRSLSQIFYEEEQKLVIAVVNHQELQGLHLRFQNSVDTLSAENRKIRRFHSEFLSQVVTLHNVDLNKNKDQWRTLVDSMRGNFEGFILQNQFENYVPWRRHLDSQIYKALEYQYRKGLETLHQNMEQLNADLVFKQGVIQFKPSFEALREAYYIRVREFISVPLRFRGLQPKREESGKYEIYPNLPLTSNERIISVHSKSIELFSKLQQLRKALRSHVLIGQCGTNNSPDLDTIVEQWLKGNNNFAAGFQLVKDRLAKLNKMEDVKRIDCFAVSIVPVKASIEEQLRRLEESLLNEMRKHIQTTLTGIDNFVFNASNVVERQPTTMDEVGKANQAYREYLSQIPVYEERFQEIEEMNRELRLHCGTSIEFGPTKTRWEHLREAMASHTKVIESAVAKMRVSLDSLIQKFLKDVQRFSSNWGKQKNNLLDAFKKSKKEEVQKLIAALKDQVNDLDDLKKQSEELEAKCKYFNVPKPNFNALSRTSKDVEKASEMWALYDGFNEELDIIRKEDWLTFRAHTYQFNDFCKDWKSKAKKTDSKEKENVVSDYLVSLIDGWEEFLPVLKFCRGDGWMTEHWNELFRLLDIPKGMTSTELTFGDILDHYKMVIEKQSDIKKLHARAEGEIQIREALQDLRVWALEANFTLISPADSNLNVLLITEWKDVMTQVSENQALVASLKDSPFYQHFADEAAGWESKLLAVSESLVLLNNIQRKWTYLEPIFARGALPQEQARFKRVDKEFTAILRDIEADSRVMSLASQSDFNDKLKNILEQIERCQKALQEFLETKRNKFPRFYFISDEDLLEILGHSQNPNVIQSHLKKLFMGIHSVKFNAESTAITDMCSADGENVPMSVPVSITEKNVEDWLIRLDDSMRQTIKELLIMCVKEGNPTAEKVIKKYPSQVLQVAEQIIFGAQVEKAIHEKTLQDVLLSQKKELEKLTSLSEMSAVDMLKVKALILDVIHNIEIVEMLIDKSVKSIEEWWWQKQLRYVFNSKSMSCLVRMIDTVFDYSYEYQGNAPKLVHTPLTDKCYLVLTKGMNLGYGGNPYGPAGTGKTESVKALGSAMGRQVLVFNCDEGIDFKAMGRIFIGIVKCGAWGCFDEFNRLKIDQLSAISQMIQVIQEALKRKDPACHLLGHEVEVNQNSGIFVTLNPAGKGYGGRTKLPDNLKQLFREVAMTIPDNELITSTMLLSEGFTYGKALAQKVVELYKLSSQLMSKQQHYDWGLRPLKAVLRLGGTLVQRWKQKNAGEASSEKVESELILQSLYINTLSKLTYEDAKLFSGLVQDIFPGVEGREVTYPELEEAIKTAVKGLGLQLVPSQVKKVLQAYESMNQRMGVVLVGPSGSGKSTLIKILRKALEVMGIDVPMHIMNPKAMSRRQLLGYMDPDTREWSDGVLTSAARDAAKQPSTSRPWIVCDGDIDPEWIESLNSVLDDNKLLTMPNGVRIQFGSNVNFVFETHSLEYASPATVSRMGVLYFSDKDIHLEEVVESLMQQQKEEVRKLINPLIMKYTLDAINQALRSNCLSVPTTKMGLLNACLNHVMGAVNEADFIYATIRGLGSALTAEGAVKVAKWLYEASGQRPLSDSRPLDTFWHKRADKPLEFKADLTVDVEAEQFVNGKVPLVNTVEVQRIKAVLAPLLRSSKCKPFFLVGPEGCGKSAILKHCLLGYETYRSTFISCSSQTTSSQVIQKLENSCSLFTTSSGRVLRPKDGDRLVLVLQNVNLPKPDKYGTVELHSFIQQLVLYHGFYNKDLEWIAVEKIQIVATMNPVLSAGRYPVVPRLLAVVNIITMTYPSRSSLMSIYSTYWSALLKETNIGGGKTYDNGVELAQFILNVYEKIRKRFEGEAYAHFNFCPRHLTQWIGNVLQYNIDANVSLPAVLAYEASRIFSDCLPTPEDRQRAEKVFIDQLASIGYSVPPKEDKYATMFASWFTDIVTEISSGLLRFSREFKELHIPMIPEVVSWITRVDRVLARSRGHLIVVGRPGVGRRDAVIIAAYMQRIEIATLNVTHDYNLKQFRQELRGYIQRAVTQNARMVLIIEDHHFIDEGFLELINGLVSSGEVPGLFNPEEMESIYSQLREEAVVDGFIGTAQAYFVERLRRNLRIALIMDNEHELFLVRLQSNPGLLSKCELLWIGGWTTELAKTICKDRLKDQIKALDSDSAYKNFFLHREMLSIHSSIASATPKDLETMMDTYKQIILLKSKSSSDKIERLESGLAKLKEAERSVDKIKKDVARKKSEVETMQKDADDALNEIQKNMENSQEQRDQAAELQEQLKEEHQNIVVKKQKSEEELSSILPMMESARDAVSSIQSQSLNEIRSLPSPPSVVQDVLEGVLALLGVSDVSWKSMRKFLGERGVKERILAFKVEDVTPAIRNRVSKLLQQKPGSFKREVIFHASAAAAPMAEWVIAIVQYATVMERISPLTRQLQQLEDNEKEGEEKLKELKKKLKKIDQHVEGLLEEFSKKCKEAEKLRGKLEKAEEELTKSQELLSKLSEEKTRWAKEAAAIKEINSTMPKGALVAAAFMTYLGKEPEEVREKQVRQWSTRFGFSEPLKVSTFLRTEGELLQFKAEGLPGDDLSMENAVVVLESLRTPLVIDPANRAIEWVRQHLISRNTVVEMTSMHDERFTHTLELAIRFGKTLLVTEVSEIKPMLFPILRCDLTSAGAKRTVQVGNKSVDWQDTFKMVLFTRNTDLRLAPGTAALIEEINFSVTSLGLESQLLGVTIKHEKPELEAQKLQLLEKEEKLKIEINQLESRLLQELADSSGDLLENTQLINSLNEVKTQSISIQQALKESHKLQQELDSKRDVYRPFAHHGSLLFFVVKDLGNLNRMYQFGLNDFLSMFTKTLKSYQGSDDLQVKIPTLQNEFARMCFHHVSIGLMKKDRLAFGLNLIRRIKRKEYPKDLWNALVGAVTNVKSLEEVPLPRWAPGSAQAKLAAIASSETGEQALQKWSLGDENKWSVFMQHPNPEVLLQNDKKLTPMDQLLLLNAFRPDRLTACSMSIILKELKLDAIVPSLSLEDLIRNSDASAPVLLITSSGADPSMEVQDIANANVGRDRFVQIALGGGQTDEALQQVRRGAVQGSWVFLKNLHLVLDWTSVLEKELCTMPKPDKNFRLIITTEQHELFPTVLLRMSTKLAVEAPPGVKQNLLRTYTTWDRAFLESLPEQGAQMLFGLAWFHAVVFERRSFVPQGWIKYYEFSNADLKAASDIIVGLSRQRSIDWVTVVQLLQQCVYGGRLENPQDERVLAQLINLYFNDQVLIRASAPLHHKLKVPQTSNHDAVMVVVKEQIPDVDSPSTFHLPANADRAVLETAAAELRETLRDLTKMSQKDSVLTHNWGPLLAPVLELWKSSGISSSNTLLDIPSSKTPDPMEIFFVSEVNSIIAIMEDISALFSSLKLVSEGTLIPSADLRDDALELAGGRMPLKWLERMDGPVESKLWLSLLARKYTSTLGWSKQLMSSSIVYDLSSLLRPDTFFNALRQHTARQTRAPLVDLCLVASVGTNSITEGLQVSVSIKASTLFLQGAKMGKEGLLGAVSAASPSSTPLTTNIVLGWIQKERVQSKFADFVRVPVFSSITRESYLFDLFVGCKDKSDESQFSLCGVAAYVSPV
eukprot:gene8408-5889_t